MDSNKTFYVHSTNQHSRTSWQEGGNIKMNKLTTGCVLLSLLNRVIGVVAVP